MKDDLKHANQHCSSSTVCPQRLTNLIQLLRRRVQEHREKTVFTYLKDGESQETRLTYCELERRALAIAALLQSRFSPGERVLLIYPPGIEFPAAFFGCLCAGMIAVTAYPPQSNLFLATLEATVSDAEPAVALTTASILEEHRRQIDQTPGLMALQWIPTDTISDDMANAWQEPSLGADSIALLQYTSGSTGSPKGVMVSHGNLLHNSAVIHAVFGNSPSIRGVIWLPPYHDMGLIGGIIQPVYAGMDTILISPVHFIQKPLRWLMAISRYKATVSGGPNFAYDLCVRKITTEQKSGLDLSSWDIAFNGAEPVRRETLRRFAAAFESCGFRQKAYLPCYGLAETTLIASGSKKGSEPTFVQADAHALKVGRLSLAAGDREHDAKLVGNGGTPPDHTIVIVDPEEKTPCKSATIGEIWIAGPSVAKGYWNRPEDSEQTFRARLADTDEGPFLRTGDLGFFHAGQLFVAGRLKDLIIIRGLNHYPQDIERTVERSHEALRASGGAAFSVEVGDEERLVVVQEIERRFIKKIDAEAVISAIRQSVTREHGIQAYAVVLLKTSSLPKTTSGKVQRRLCREHFIQGRLKVVAECVGYSQEVESEIPLQARKACRPGHMRADGSAAGRLQVVGSSMKTTLKSGGPASDETETEDASKPARVIESAITKMVADLLKISFSRVDVQGPLNAMGIDSLLAVELKTAIEEDMGVEFPVEALFLGAGISDLAEHVFWQRTSGRGLEAKDGPLGKVLSRGRQSDQPAERVRTLRKTPEIEPECLPFEEYPEYRSLQRIMLGMKARGIDNPYFRVHERANSHGAVAAGREFITFSRYNYLGMSGDPHVSQAAKDAIDRYGTSVSASRLVSGERPLHRELEKELADLIGTKDSLVFVSGHATNVTAIGHLFGKSDLIVHDALIHNSVLQGCQLSQAAHLSFPHNDWHALDIILSESRSRFRRALVVLEGLYSMDGDIPELPEFIRIKKRHGTYLMVDEAHSIGVLGKRGRGIGEHFGTNPADVDIWMGTLSKSFASCGGFIAGSGALIEYLKYTAPGFVYSVGMSPPNVGAALAAIRLLRKEPHRVTRLHELSGLFLMLAREKGLNIGASGSDSPVIPLIVGDSLKALRLSQAILRQGIDALPMVYPAVPDNFARLRFFVNCTHTPEQIRVAVDVVASALEAL
ncbi:MAG: aminotransferase class I/II-fold pyridoxal phosphate-dependent enzyme [Deltaproteobacteria bacterium]|nr:aminotransferase class I/II-fold pyridoxal phosphate-dependent enzyme [Deltaproteobacteria bacterium]